MKTSKVKEVFGEPKPYTNSNGTTYYHNLIMENGDEINIGKKKQLSVGDELTYELTGGDDGQQRFKKAKSVQPQQQNSTSTVVSKNWEPRDQDSILYQVCLKEAVNITIATSKETFVAASPESICALAYDLASVSKKLIQQLKNVG